MKKASIIMAVLACAMIAAAYTNSVPISTNTRAATEKWTAIRFEPALPPTPENAASKFLTGNREWQTVSADQIGALTNETDDIALAALAAHAAYWPPNATASSWFTFTTNSGAITITGYDIAGGTDVVIPDYINGWPVTEIGANAFYESGVTSIGGAGNVVMVGGFAFYYCDSLASVLLPQARTVGESAFYHCSSLASVSLPQVQTVEGVYTFADCCSLASVLLPQAKTVGSGAFADCYSLASVSLPQVQTVGEGAFYDCYSLASVYFDDHAPTIGAEIFAFITPNQVTIYVTNPQATGWGATLGGMPVVRLPLHADAIYQAGELVATEAHVAQAIASQIPGIVYSNSVSALTIYTNASGAATSWWQVASGVTNSGLFASGTPGAITNGQTGPLTLGKMQVIANGNVGFGGEPETGTGWPLTVTGSSRFNGWVYVGGMIMSESSVYNAGGYAFKTFNGDVIDAVSWTSAGNVSMPSGNLTVAKTNTAAEVRTLGGVTMPHLGTNTYVRLIFTNGTIQAWEVAQ